MSPAEVNGHGQDIHDNVIYIRGSLTQLENTMLALSNNVSALTRAIENSTTSTEKTIRYVIEANNESAKHLKESIPMRMVLIICSIIVISFVGGGVLKELIDSHVLLKWLG